jgi:hypothetical protein
MLTITTTIENFLPNLNYFNIDYDLRMTSILTTINNVTLSYYYKNNPRPDGRPV